MLGLLGPAVSGVLPGGIEDESPGLAASTSQKDMSSLLAVGILEIPCERYWRLVPQAASLTGAGRHREVAEAPSQKTEQPVEVTGEAPSPACSTSSAASR